VDFAGLPCDYDELNKLCKKRGLLLVSDAAHSLGARYRGRPVGSLADLTTFSFHPVKHITTGEGGMVTTNDARLAERLRTLRSHGMVRPQGAEPWWYEMPEPGFNYRLPDILCALGLSQLAKLDRFAARRRALARAYEAALAPLAPVVRIAARPAWSDPVLHLMCVLIDFEAAGISRGGAASQPCSKFATTGRPNRACAAIRSRQRRSAPRGRRRSARRCTRRIRSWARTTGGTPRAAATVTGT